MNTTRHTAQIEAPPAQVYRALLDPLLIPQWRVPTGMRCEVHEFEPREGGTFRVSLTYDSPTSAGKSTAHTDTYHGHFEQLIPNERVVEHLEFETTDPLMQGAMRITTDLAAVGGGTFVTAMHEGLPPGVSPADNEAGWQDSLAKLAALLSVASPSSLPAGGRSQLHPKSSDRRDTQMTAEDFVTAYGAALASQQWALVEPLVHENVCVTFSNGTVHIGKTAVRNAYEANFSAIEAEDYRISNVHWVRRGEDVSVYVFDFAWSGRIDGRDVNGAGRGTSVLVRNGSAWQLLAEHLGPPHSPVAV